MSHELRSGEPDRRRARRRAGPADRRRQGGDVAGRPSAAVLSAAVAAAGHRRGGRRRQAVDRAAPARWSVVVGGAGGALASAGRDRRGAAPCRRRPVLVCAADMPFVPPALFAELAGGRVRRAPRRRSRARSGARCSRCWARYDPAALAALSAAASDAVAPARAVVAALRPLRVPVEDPRALFNVNTPRTCRGRGAARGLCAAGLTAPVRRCRIRTGAGRFGVSRA